MGSEGRASIEKQLEELQLLHCSLLPDEHIDFLNGSEDWSSALQSYADGQSQLNLPPLDAVSFSIRLDNAKVWFDIMLSGRSSASEGAIDCKKNISVKGEGITRAEQDKWQNIIAEHLEEISDSEYPIYQLVSLHLLPLLREETASQQAIDSEETESRIQLAPAVRPSEGETYHVLFTSHHLISPNKRRSLQQWTSSLALEGFAKVGYPGVIYAQGERQNVEEFVENVKAMQWLALKVRFVEPLPPRLKDNSANVQNRQLGRWKEFQKVGEVVEEMRRIGREEYVVEMGIGSAGTKL